MYNELEILKQFGRNVKAERIRLGYSQESLAEKIGVNRKYVTCKNYSTCKLYGNQH